MDTIYLLNAKTESAGGKAMRKKRRRDTKYRPIVFCIILAIAELIISYLYLIDTNQFFTTWKDILYLTVGEGLISGTVQVFQKICSTKSESRQRKYPALIKFAIVSIQICIVVFSCGASKETWREHESEKKEAEQAGIDVRWQTVETVKKPYEWENDIFLEDVEQYSGVTYVAENDMAIYMAKVISTDLDSGKYSVIIPSESDLQEYGYNDLVKEANEWEELYTLASENKLLSEKKYTLLENAIEVRKAADDKYKMPGNQKMIGNDYEYLGDMKLALGQVSDAYDKYELALHYFVSAFRTSVIRGKMETYTLKQITDAIQNVCKKISNLEGIDQPGIAKANYLAEAYGIVLEKYKSIVVS